jgi:hypothetical protein
LAYLEAKAKATTSARAKYGDLSAAQWTVKLSVAPVEMTFVCGWQTGEHATSKEEADPYGMTTKRANGKSKRKDKSKGKDKSNGKGKSEMRGFFPIRLRSGSE